MLLNKLGKIIILNENTSSFTVLLAVDKILFKKLYNHGKLRFKSNFIKMIRSVSRV